MIRTLNIVALVAVAVLAVGTFRAKTEARVDRERLAVLEEEVRVERRAVRLLAAEIAHLERPQRLRVLAEERLGLTLAQPMQIVALQDAAGRFRTTPPTYHAGDGAP